VSSGVVVLPRFSLYLISRLLFCSCCFFVCLCAFWLLTYRTTRLYLRHTVVVVMAISTHLDTYNAVTFDIVNNNNPPSHSHGSRIYVYIGSYIAKYLHTVDSSYGKPLCGGWKRRGKIGVFVFHCLLSWMCLCFWGVV